MLLDMTAPAFASPSVPPVTSAAPAPAAVTAKPLANVIINGVLFRAVEFDTEKAVWRNLAITVIREHLAAWRALPAESKSQYAEQMIENYRDAMKFDRDIKLTFIDENSVTLDQYLWTPPAKK